MILLYFHPGDLSGAEFIGILGLFLVLPVAVIFILYRIFFDKNRNR